MRQAGIEDQDVDEVKPDNLYQPPEANLSPDSPERQTIQRLHDQQNGVAAVLVASIVVTFLTVLWVRLGLTRTIVTPVMFIASGVAIGLIVRVVGRPVTGPLRYAAALFQLYTAFLALYVIGVPLISPRGLEPPAIVYLALLLTGSGTAFALSARGLSDDKKSALWKHAHGARPPTVRLRNRVWLMLVVALPAAFAALIVAVVGSTWGRV